MNPARPQATLAYTLGILGSLLIVAWLVWVMHRYTQPAPLGEDHKAMRAKNLSELRGAEHEALTTTAWIDQPKGIVRLRIQDAMALVERAWQNPPAARSNLIARVEKATFVPPPAPAPPSPFE
jgi:uncharacterized protein YdaU (DUF1376 family)